LLWNSSSVYMLNEYWSEFKLWQQFHFLSWVVWQSTLIAFRLSITVNSHLRYVRSFNIVLLIWIFLQINLIVWFRLDVIWARLRALKTIKTCSQELLIKILILNLITAQTVMLIWELNHNMLLLINENCNLGIRISLCSCTIMKARRHDCVREKHDYEMCLLFL